VDGGPGVWIGVRGLGWEGEQVVEAARQVPLEAAERSLLGLALGLLAREVGSVVRVVVGAGDGDDVQRVIELAAREGVPLIVIQRQLGHSNLASRSIYLQGIDNAEIIETVDGRGAPMIPVSTSLRL
jgi:hypothetical protein